MDLAGDCVIACGSALGLAGGAICAFFGAGTAAGVVLAIFTTGACAVCDAGRDTWAAQTRGTITPAVIPATNNKRCGMVNLIRAFHRLRRATGYLVVKGSA